MLFDVYCFVIYVRKINCVLYLYIKVILNKLFKNFFLFYLIESIVRECCIDF